MTHVHQIKRVFKKIISNKKFISIAPLLFLLLIFLFYPVSHIRLSGNSSLRLFSKENNVIRQFANKTLQSYSIWQNLHEYPEFLKTIIIKAEDKRFYYHPGFDPIAIFRSLWLNISNGRIISGGSTITQQLVRIAYKDKIPKNAFLRKIFELFYSLRLECNFSKKRILEAYINRIPLKFNQIGFASASKRIFKKDSKFLTKQEIVALTILIRNLQTKKALFLKRFNYLWNTLYKKPVKIEPYILKALFSKSSYSYFQKESKTIHFETWLAKKFPELTGDIYTTISQNLNDKIEAIINNELAFLKEFNVNNGSVIVLKLPTTDDKKLSLVAMVGSKNFHGKIHGQINGSIVLRNAGSTLKPLIYGLAFDKLDYSPHSMLKDIPISILTSNNESYRPKNYDLEYWGNLTARESLACSRNIPAVSLANKIGFEKFYSYLKSIGFNHLQNPPEYYGPGIALGTARSSLLILARIYAGIANKGIMLPIYFGKDNKGQPVEIGNKYKIMSEKSSYQITHILADTNARRRTFGTRNFLDFPFEVAAKTGTSKDYRDAWTIGYTNKHVVAAWVGNFSSKPMNQISGGWGAGRIFHQVIRLLTNRSKPSFTYPKYLIIQKRCRKTGLLPNHTCSIYNELVDTRLHSEKKCTTNHKHNDKKYITNSIEVISPINGETYILDHSMSLAHQEIPLKILHNTKVNDIYFYQINAKQRRLLTESIEESIKLNPGTHVIKIFRKNKLIDSITFYVK